MPLGLAIPTNERAPSGQSASTSSAPRQCIKCPRRAQVISTNVTYCYCHDCFVASVDHKWRSAMGKHKVFRQLKHNKGEPVKEAERVMVVYTGTESSAAMLSLLSAATHSSTEKSAVSRRLHVRPHVCVLITQYERVDEIIQHVTRMRTTLREKHGHNVESWTWSCEHVASVFCNEAPTVYKSNEDIVSCDSAALVDKCAALFTAMDESKTQNGTSISSLREHLRLHCILRLARQLGIAKVMLDDTADMLARWTFNAMCTGRGALIANMTSVVDDTYGDVQFVRPFRDVSNKECAVYLHLTQHMSLVYIDQEEQQSTAHATSSIASVTDSFFTHLQSVNHSTTSTVLATAAKLVDKQETTGLRRCTACYTPITMAGRNYCECCELVVNDDFVRGLMPKCMLFVE